MDAIPDALVFAVRHGETEWNLVGRQQGHQDSPLTDRGKKPVRNEAWFRLVAVPVEQNTGPVGFTEKPGEINRHAARRAPFWVYDAMEPVGRAVKAVSSLMALRLHLPVPLTFPGRTEGDENVVWF